MVEPISTANWVSARESKLLTSASTHRDKNNERIDNSSQETKPAKKQDEPIEEIQKSSKELVEHTIEAIKKYIESTKRSLDISVHQETGDIMVKVISEKDGKVIREIPPEKLLDLASRMEEFAGTLFNENA